MSRSVKAYRQQLEARVGHPEDFRGAALVRYDGRRPVRYAVYRRPDGSRLIVVA